MRRARKPVPLEIEGVLARHRLDAHPLLRLTAKL